MSELKACPDPSAYAEDGYGNRMLRRDLAAYRKQIAPKPPKVLCGKGVTALTGLCLLERPCPVHEKAEREDHR
jgi:hypothetical protein